MSEKIYILERGSRLFFGLCARSLLHPRKKTFGEEEEKNRRKQNKEMSYGTFQLVVVVNYLVGRGKNWKEKPFRPTYRPIKFSKSISRLSITQCQRRVEIDVERTTEDDWKKREATCRHYSLGRDRWRRNCVDVEIGRWQLFLSAPKSNGNKGMNGESRRYRPRRSKNLNIKYITTFYDLHWNKSYE